MQKKGEARERRSSADKCRKIQFGGGGGRGGEGLVKIQWDSM